MRRLFSTFAHGAPGVGLLLLRFVVALAVVFHAMAALRGASIELATVCVLTGVVGVLLFFGLWTPIAGTLLAILATSSAFLHRADPWSCIFLGSLGAALALLGPGAWSVDAYLFGWKRVELPDRKS